MTKLKTFFEKYNANTKDEKSFIDQHKVDKKEDRNGNKDDVFTASNVKKYDRKSNRQGYEPGEDESVNEEAEQLTEKALKPGQKLTREELAKLIRKANPHIDPSQAHAMAVATAQRVEESVEQIVEGPIHGKEYPLRHVETRISNGDWEATHDLTPGKTLEIIDHKRGGIRTTIRVAHQGKNRQGLTENSTGKVNQINELSNETLKSYASKASNDRTKRFGDERKYNNRMKGTSKAVEKMAKEEMELEEAASPTAGTRLVSKHPGKDGYHAEIRHNKDWGEYQVHHYHNGKHLGEGPVSYHDNKADAKETAEWCAKNNCVKNGKVVTEDVEQINELSKGTVKKYIGHATADLETNKRVLAATAKRTGRSLDDVYDDPKSGNLTKRQYNRYRGIDTALGKIQPNDKWTKVRATNEDVEQINEISKQKAGEYIRRAVNDVEDRSYWAGRDADLKKRPYASYPNKKQDQRLRGIGMAIKKLTKEDIINNAIERYLPEAPMSTQDVFESRVSNLPTQHQTLLGGLFETLSEGNKLTMLEQMSTEEGLNNLLDFAIHARGV